MQNLLIFTANHATMKLLKLTALIPVCLAVCTVFTSCEEDSELDRVNSYVKTDIPLTGAQVAPVPTNSTALGKLSVGYDKRHKVLNYEISWTGLRDTITGITIFGPAPAGYASASVKQAVPAFTSDLKANQRNFPYAAGSYKGSVNVDDVVVKEQDLLNYYYYMVIRTKAFTSGEIRAQIKFQ